MIHDFHDPTDSYSYNTYWSIKVIFFLNHFLTLLKNLEIFEYYYTLYIYIRIE